MPCKTVQNQDIIEICMCYETVFSHWTQVKAIAQMLVRFNWTWVGLVRGDHEYGRFAVQGLIRELQGTKVCVAYQEMIPLLYDRQRALEIMQVDYVE